MGAWGNGPLDSDQGLDWLIDPATQAVLQIRSLCEVSHGREAEFGHELRAATVLWMALNRFSHSRYDDTAGMLMVSLEALANDPEWIQSWTEPEQVRKLILEEIKGLK